MNEKCFALKNGRCRALEGNCPGYAACGFYRPRWKYELDQKKINVRLSRLPIQKQTEIADKYYKGNMPWRDD